MVQNGLVYNYYNPPLKFNPLSGTTKGLSTKFLVLLRGWVLREGGGLSCSKLELTNKFLLDKLSKLDLSASTNK